MAVLAVCIELFAGPDPPPSLPGLRDGSDAGVRSDRMSVNGHNASTGAMAALDGAPGDSMRSPQGPVFGNFDSERIREIMRLWSLHPRLLDRAALVGCWREALLAQKVLSGGTVGYRTHPQLHRFRATESPDGVISAFLHGLAEEAAARGYNFDRGRIVSDPALKCSLTVTIGQLDFEMSHLRAKVLSRAPEWLSHLDRADAHPIFRITHGSIEEWERGVHRQS